MGKGYGIKGRPATLTAPPLPGQQQVNLKTPNIPDAQGAVKLVFLLALRPEVTSVGLLNGLTRILMRRQQIQQKKVWRKVTSPLLIKRISLPR